MKNYEVRICGPELMTQRFLIEGITEDKVNQFLINQVEHFIYRLPAGETIDKVTDPKYFLLLEVYDPETRQRILFWRSETPFEVTLSYNQLLPVGQAISFTDFYPFRTYLHALMIRKNDARNTQLELKAYKIITLVTAYYNQRFQDFRSISDLELREEFKAKLLDEVGNELVKQVVPILKEV